MLLSRPSVIQLSRCPILKSLSKTVPNLLGESLHVAHEHHRCVCTGHPMNNEWTLTDGLPLLDRIGRLPWQRSLRRLARNSVISPA